MREFDEKRAGVTGGIEERREVALPSSMRAAAIATFFFTIGCYTLLAPLQGRIPIGAAALPFGGAVILAAALVTAGIGAAISIAREWSDERVRATLPIVALWFGALLLPAFGTFLPARTWPFIGLAVLCAASFIAIVRWWREPRVARALIATYLCGGLVLVIASLVMLATHRPSMLYAVNLGRATGFFITPNQYAAWLVPYMATASGLALASRSRMRRIVAASAAVLAAFALILTFSFGGWLGGATAVICGAWWLGARRLAIVTGITFAILGVIALALPNLTHHRAAERFVRIDALQAGLRMAAHFPLTGVGPLAYRAVYPLVRAPDSTEDDVIAEHPHNVVMSLLAEIGCAGTLAIAAGWWRALRTLRRTLASASPAARRAVACIGAGIAGRFAHGSVDLVGVLEAAFVWLPFAALMLAIARDGMPEEAG